jgi:hypothetical protein
VNVLKAIQILVASNCLKKEDLLLLLPNAEKILLYYSASGQ